MKATLSSKGPEANLRHLSCFGWSAPITPNICVNLILQSARCRKAIKHGVKKDFSRLYVLRLGLCVVICERLRALDKSSCESWNEVPLCLTCRPRSRIWCMKRWAEELRCPSASWSQILTGYEPSLVLCSLFFPFFFFQHVHEHHKHVHVSLSSWSLLHYFSKIMLSVSLQSCVVSVLQYHWPKKKSTYY